MGNRHISVGSVMDEKSHIEKYRGRRLAMFEHKVREKVVESILDDYRAAAGHLINALGARFGLHEQNFDRLERFVRAHPEAFSKPDELAGFYNRLKDLRGAVVYGGRRDGETLKKAEELLAKIKEVAGIDPDSSG